MKFITVLEDSPFSDRHGRFKEEVKGSYWKVNDICDTNIRGPLVAFETPAQAFGENNVDCWELGHGSVIMITGEEHIFAGRRYMQILFVSNAGNARAGWIDEQDYKKLLPLMKK